VVAHQRIDRVQRGIHGGVVGGDRDGIPAERGVAAALDPSHAGVRVGVQRIHKGIGVEVADGLAALRLVKIGVCPGSARAPVNDKAHDCGTGVAVGQADRPVAAADAAVHNGRNIGDVLRLCAGEIVGDSKAVADGNARLAVEIKICTQNAADSGIHVAAGNGAVEPAVGDQGIGGGIFPLTDQTADCVAILCGGGADDDSIGAAADDLGVPCTLTDQTAQHFVASGALDAARGVTVQNGGAVGPVSQNALYQMVVGGVDVSVQYVQVLHQSSVRKDAEQALSVGAGLGSKVCNVMILAVERTTEE